MKNLLVQKKKVKFDDIELEFKALTTNDLFALLNDYPDFVNWLFAGVDIESQEEFSRTVFMKYPQIMSLILALTCCNLEKVTEEKLSMEEKLEIFIGCNITNSLEALNAVVELTFKSGVAATVGKWKRDLNVIMEIFFQAKTEASHQSK